MLQLFERDYERDFGPNLATRTNKRISHVDDMQHIPLERKCTQKNPSVGGNVKNRIAQRLHNVATFAWVLSETFWDMKAFLMEKFNGNAVLLIPLSERSHLLNTCISPCSFQKCHDSSWAVDFRFPPVSAGCVGCRRLCVHEHHDFSARPPGLTGSRPKKWKLSFSWHTWPDRERRRNVTQNQTSP